MSASDAIQWVLRQEDSTLSGKVVNLNDGAGLTRFGITSRVNPPAYFYTKPASEALVDAILIYTIQFWNPLSCDRLNYFPLAASLLSFAINDGEGFAAHYLLQRVLGVAEDGIIGPATVAAANAEFGTVLLQKLQDAQWAHYQATAAANPADAKDLAGWHARAYRVYPSLI